MNKKVFIILLILSVWLTACGPSAGERLNEGNEAFDEEQYEAALEAYEEAQNIAPELAEPAYNAGNTYYRQSGYGKARPLLEQALRHAKGELAEFGFYNLGNALFNEQQFESAIEAYKAALRLNPDNMDAKHNLELALEQQEEQEPPPEEQEPPPPEEQEPPPEEEQEPPPEEEQEPPPEGQEPPPEGEDEQDQEQSPEGEQDQEQSPEGEQDQEQSPEGEQDQEQSPDGEQDQEQPPEGEQNQEPPEGQQGEEEPPDEEEPPEDQGQSEGEQDEEEQDQEPPEGSGQPNEAPPEGDQEQQMPPQLIPLTEEQARQLLQSIRQETQTLQEKLQEIYVVPGGPPEEDW